MEETILILCLIFSNFIWLIVYLDRHGAAKEYKQNMNFYRDEYIKLTDHSLFLHENANKHERPTTQADIDLSKET